MQPRPKSEAELVQPATGIEPHQQVYMITQEIKRKGMIASRRDSHEWVFFIGYAVVFYFLTDDGEIIDLG